MLREKEWVGNRKFAHFNAMWPHKGRVEGETGSRYEDVVTGVGDRLDGELKSVRAAAGEDEVVGVDGRLGRRHVTSERFSHLIVYQIYKMKFKCTPTES